MGSIAYIRQVFDDSAWFAQAEPIYEGNETKFERLPYDRTERVISRELRDKETILLPANNSVQILRALRLADEWKISAVIYGGQQGYEVEDVIAAKKIPVLINLKWPERVKDADPEADQTLRELRFRDRAPSSPAALAKSGVKFAFYSGGLSGPKDILKNARKAIAAGLTSDAADSASRRFTFCPPLGNSAGSRSARRSTTSSSPSTIFSSRTPMRRASFASIGKCRGSRSARFLSRSQRQLLPHAGGAKRATYGGS